MALPGETDSPALVSDEKARDSTIQHELPAVFRVFGEPDRWDRPTYVGLLALVLLWAVQLYLTWGAWGELATDSGREMYVPALLAEGKVLYRDVWFPYGPAAPYFNSILFRAFGIHLSVLYWAGALSALGSAVLLYRIGMRLSSSLVGWTAAAVLLLEAFQPSLFCFPLPYSFSAVYGCLVACLFLLFALCVLGSSGWPWMFASGSAAAAALLLKPEFGMACYVALALLMGMRVFSWRSWRLIGRDIAVILPGLAICGVVLHWMISIAGVAFITQENVMSWPTSYFMKTYGRLWLESIGFSLTAHAFRDAAVRTIPVAGVGLLTWSILWRRTDRWAIVQRVLLFLVVILYFIKYINLRYLGLLAAQFASSAIFFPRDMVLYICLAAALGWWYFWRGNSRSDRLAAIPLLLTFSALLGFRILMRMMPAGYPIYYNGPAVLSFLLLASRIVPRSGRSPRFVVMGESAICLLCLLTVVLAVAPRENAARAFVPLSTPRGTVRLWPHLALSYEDALRFIKEKNALGESVLSVPEDTSLYFFSSTECPSRVYAFDPGVLTPGEMTDEAIREIDRKSPRYLLWSNRVYGEYGVPVFGVDFDRELGNYLKAHYRPVGPLSSRPRASGDWAAVIWERNSVGLK